MKLIQVASLLVLWGASCSQEPAVEPTPDVGQNTGEQIGFDLPLPDVSIFPDCQGIVRDLSGGDLAQAFDRIVVGRVASISAAPFLGYENCPLGSGWITVQVDLEVEENLLGEGDVVTFYMDADGVPVRAWSSRPKSRQPDGAWIGILPEGPPAVLVSESFGWTHPAGIYPGEQLLVMLATDKNGRLTPDWFPLAKGIGHDKFLFQTMRNPYLCWVLPPAFSGTTTLEAMRAELKEEPVNLPRRKPWATVVPDSRCGEEILDPPWDDAGF